MSLFSLTLRGRSFPSDLPLSDVMPLEEFSGNAGGLWKIYRSKLASTKSEISVFIFDKATIQKLKQKKTILKSVWKHVEMVQNIQKYSSVTLKIILTAKENRKYIAYATEPVIGSLSNVLGDYPNDISKSQASLLNKMNLCEMQIKYGVVSIAETLSYLHLYEGMIHCDVSPRNVIVCSNGAWRLAGYHFIMRADSPYCLNLNTAPDSVTSNYLQPDINFCGPGLFRGPPTQESDVFSLGMLITCVYNNAISLLEGTGIVSELGATSQVTGVYQQLYDERISSAYNAIKSKIPQGLQHGLSKIISFDAEVRPTAQQLLMLGYYDDPLIKYLKRINLYENLCDRDKEEVLSVELPHCAKHLTQTMMMSHVVPVLKSELDMRNRSPGVLTSLVMCLNRQTLSSKNSQILSGLVNQALAIEHDQQALSHKSHQVIMENISMLYSKSQTMDTLYDPMPVVIAGLRVTETLPATLKAIATLVEHKESRHVLTQYKIIDEVKGCFECHRTQPNQDVCAMILRHLLRWLELSRDGDLTSNVTMWIVGELEKQLDLLPAATEFIEMMLANPVSYGLTSEFVESDLSSSIERLATSSDISLCQRQSLIQLARSLEQCTKVSHPDKPKASVVRLLSHERPPLQSPRTIPIPTSGSTTPVCLTPGSLTRASSTTSGPSVSRQCSTTSSTSSSIPDIKIDTPPLSQQPPYFPVADDMLTKHQRHKSQSITGMRRSLDSPDAKEKRKQLLRMDLSPSRVGLNRSFGDLMADIEDEQNGLSPLARSRTPKLSRDNRASSLQTPNSGSTDEEDQKRRRPSLQAEHYQNLANFAAVPSSPTQNVGKKESSNLKVDILMKTILQKLDSLTGHCNGSKEASPSQEH